MTTGDNKSNRNRKRRKQRRKQRSIIVSMPPLQATIAEQEWRQEQLNTDAEVLDLFRDASELATEHDLYLACENVIEASLRLVLAKHGAQRGLAIDILERTAPARDLYIEAFLAEALEPASNTLRDSHHDESRA